MHIATQEGHYDFVELLIKHNARVNLTTKVSLLQQLSMFVLKAVIHAIIQNDWTPLHVAAQYNRSRVAQLLIDNGANIEAKTKVCSFHNLYSKDIYFKVC